MASKSQKKRGFLLPEIIDGHELIDVCLKIPNNFEYKTAFVGQLWELGNWWLWDREDGQNGRNIKAGEYWRQILFDHLRFGDDCAACQDCIEYPPNAAFIEWLPQNPFTQPDFVPDDYAFPPWYLATTLSNIALGTQLGDVVTDITRFPTSPIIQPSTGWPRFRITVSGPSSVDIYMRNILAGSYAQVTVDDDLLSIEFVDVNKDVTVIPPETGDEVIIHREIPAGDHWIDVLIIPNANDQIPFLHFGGALTKVVICGQIQPCEDCEDCMDEECCNAMVNQLAVISDVLQNQLEGINARLAALVAAQCPCEDPVPPVVEPDDPEIDLRCRVAANLGNYMVSASNQPVFWFNVQWPGAVPFNTFAAQFPYTAPDTLKISQIWDTFRLSANPEIYTSNILADLVTSEFREQVICALYCVLGSDGKITEEIRQAWIGAIPGVALTTPAELYVSSFINAAPLSYIQSQASLASIEETSFDCTVCGCYFPPVADLCIGEYDFTVDQFNWYKNPRGEYVGGTGWRSEQHSTNVQQLWIRLDCDAAPPLAQAHYVRVTISAGWNTGGAGSLFVGYINSAETKVRGGGVSLANDGIYPKTVLRTFASGLDLKAFIIEQAITSTNAAARLVVSKVEIQTTPF